MRKVCIAGLPAALRRGLRRARQALRRALRGRGGRVLARVLCVCLCLAGALGLMAVSVSAAVCDSVRERIVEFPPGPSEAGGPYDCVLVLGCAVYED